MKKHFLPTFALLAIIGLSATSCKKDYTCKCDRIRTGSSGSTTTQEAVYTFKDTRVKAEDKCDDKETTGSDLFGNYSIECRIDD